MTTTPNMGLTLPTDHGSADTWDVILDAVFASIDSHDHSTGKGVKVPVAGLNVNADLSFSPAGTPYAARDVKAIDFMGATVSSVVGYAGALFMNDGDSELYWRSTGGVNVKITSGASLNVSQFTGGIGGDYSAVGALVSFDDATDSYWFQQQGSPRPWARLRAGDLDLYETAASITNRVRLRSPAALAASYALTMPSALPGSTLLVQVDSSGNISLSNTIVNDVALSGNAVLAANKSVTVSGTGRYKQPSFNIPRVLSINSPSNVAAGSIGFTAGQSGISLGNNTIVYLQLPDIPSFCRLVSVQVYFNSAPDRGNCTCQLYSTSAADPATTTFTNTSAGPSSIGTAITQFTSVNLTPTGAQTYWVQVSNSISTPKIIALVAVVDVI